MLLYFAQTFDYCFLFVCQPVKRLQYAFTKFLNVAVKRQKKRYIPHEIGVSALAAFIALDVYTSFVGFSFFVGVALLLLICLLRLDAVYIYHMAIAKSW